MAKHGIEITLNDNKKRTLRYDFNALCDLESEYGSRTLERVFTVLQSGVGFGDIRILLWAGLRHEDEGLTIRKVGETLDSMKIVEYANLVSEAFMLAFPQEDKEKNAEGSKPTANQKTSTK